MWLMNGYPWRHPGINFHYKNWEMGAWEDVCEDLGFSDMHAQISPKNQPQHCLTKQDKGIKNPSQNIHWFSKKSVFLNHMDTFSCSIVQLKVMSTSHATFDGIKTCLIVGYSTCLVSNTNQNPTRNRDSCKWDPWCVMFMFQRFLFWVFPVQLAYTNVNKNIFILKRPKWDFYKANKVC